ncbi:hypothetical protein D2E76_16390 [Mycobacteroides abscessus]|uniref:Uncharacterized protein n=1 Tax=Mycobacteroides abscessus TaxID=36809 RepID=A0ABD7HMK3_9MYCO|nr:hypothetical protein [Mycobacteroides abscessus]RIT36831.1 hypothetical protein D2E76_16390 [Mycobacteroides abscessus]
MNHTTPTTLGALLMTTICGLAVLSAPMTVPARAPVAAVELSTGQTICVYEASIPINQKCDVKSAEFQHASQVPGSLRTLVRAIKHAGEMSN